MANDYFQRYLIYDESSLPKSFGDHFFEKWRCKALAFSEVHSLMQIEPESVKLVLFCISSESFEKNENTIYQFLRKSFNIFPKFLLRAPVGYDGYFKTKLEEELFFGNIPQETPSAFLARSITTAFGSLDLFWENLELKKKLRVSSNEISKLTQIGMSLANEKDFTKLLRDILNSARELSNADSGSLYLVEKDLDGQAKHLRFKISALDLSSDEFILPIDKRSIAGYVAATGNILNIPNVYELTGKEEYSFNHAFDDKNHYYTKSMLTIPMKDHRDEVIGVIQLINRKKNFHQSVTFEEMKKVGTILTFDKKSEDLVISMAGQAAVAIQNNYLLQEIEVLFEGFVKASVSAIESRDPTTSGHSFRVALLTTGLAEAINRIDTGRFKDIHFTQTQIKEIRYASLLHDFGKVGVREKVLIKAKKLEDYELDLIRWRFNYIKKDIEARFYIKRNEYLLRHGNQAYEEFNKSLEFELSQELHGLEEMYRLIERSNEPTILEESHSHRLEEISKTCYHTTEKKEINFLSPKEFGFLSIRKGSLDFEERKEIESHVQHTFEFLTQIPWTSDLKLVPGIAHAHHEKLNGSGYPLGLEEHSIPIQSKMMTISDIFDALTDKDRPYKKAVPLERALDILNLEVKDKHVDGDLLKVFIEARVFDNLQKNLV